jgi:hypothetical protein
MLDYITRRILEPKEVKLYRELRKDDIEDIIRKAGTDNLPYPDELNCPGKIGRLVEEHVKMRAKSSLPKAQFGNTYKWEIPDSENCEVCGVINYRNGKLYELFFSPAENSGHRIILTSFGPITQACSSFNSLDEYLSIDGRLVFWHSHVHGFGCPSSQDIPSFRKISDYLKGKEIYHTIYLPSIDQLIWYQLKGFRKTCVA